MPRIRFEADRELIGLLLLIEQHDTEYATRYTLVWQALARAVEIGLPGGVAIDPNEPDWPCVYIELPTGQISWHMPKWTEPFDGHETPEKYRRIHLYALGTLPADPRLDQCPTDFQATVVPCTVCHCGLSTCARCGHCHPCHKRR